VFGLALATLSLIYFVTLVWGPDGEGNSSGKNYLKELGDPPKAASPVEPEEEGDKEVSAPLQGGTGTRFGSPSGPSSTALNTSALRPDELYNMLFSVRDAESHRPLAGATVHVAKAPGNGHVLASFRINAEGRGKLHRLPRAQYRYWVEAPGYHSSNPRSAELPLDGTRFEVQLKPAAQLAGAFEGLDGELRKQGVLHLSRAADSQVVIVRPNEYGRFASPALDGGDWSVAWIPHTRAQPAPGMSTMLELSAGKCTLLEVVLPEGIADPRHKRRPGIRLAIAAVQ